MPRVRLQRKTDWSLREAHPDDTDNIKLFLRQNIWQNKDTDTLYEWKYRDNPAGRLLAFMGTNQTQDIIACSMFMPWKLSANNRIVKACQWVDLIVDREYRGQRIPSLLLQKSLEKSRNEGSPICFAFPNNNAVPVHKKNNAIYLGHIVRYTKPLNVEYLIARFIKWGFLLKIISFFLNLILKLISKETSHLNLNRFVVEKVENCGEEFDDLWNRFRSAVNMKITTCKDREYLRWKYLSSPNRNRTMYSLRKNGQLYGFAVLESTPQIGYIVDLLATNQNAMRHLIACSIKHFRKLGKDSVVFAALENNMYFEEFKKFGFVERPDVKNFYIYLDDNMKNKEFFMDSKNWSITIGDCDIETL